MRLAFKGRQYRATPLVTCFNFIVCPVRNVVSRIGSFMSLQLILNPSASACKGYPNDYQNLNYVEFALKSFGPILDFGMTCFAPYYCCCRHIQWLHVGLWNVPLATTWNWIIWTIIIIMVWSFVWAWQAIGGSPISSGGSTCFAKGLLFGGWSLWSSSPVSSRTVGRCLSALTNVNIILWALLVQDLQNDSFSGWLLGRMGRVD